MQIKAEFTKLTTNKKGSIIQIQLDEAETKKHWTKIYPLMYSFITLDINIDNEREFEKLNRITELQRKKIFALIGDFSNHTGYSKEEAEKELKIMYLNKFGISEIHFSNCTRTEARNFISMILIEFLNNNVPLKYDFIKDFNKTEEYMVTMNERKNCCICGKDGEVGRYKNKKITVCDKHKREFSGDPELFNKKYFIEEYFECD